MFDILFFRTAQGRSPVEDFLETLPVKHHRKAMACFQFLSERGPSLQRPYAAHVRGPLWELRVDFGRHAYRFFYVVLPGLRVLMLHAFVKKQPKLPAAEIDTAENRLREFLNRPDVGRDDRETTP